MFKDSDNIYKIIGFTVCVAFLIYILIRVIQIQLDMGKHITTCGSRIKEGLEGLGKNDKFLNEKGNVKKIKSLIDVCVDNTIKNYKDAGMTIENDKDDKIDIETVKLVITLLKCKNNELMSHGIKTFVTDDGGTDFSTSSELNNTVTLIETMISTLDKLK